MESESKWCKSSENFHQCIRMRTNRICNCKYLFWLSLSGVNCREICLCASLRQSVRNSASVQWCLVFLQTLPSICSWVTKKVTQDSGNWIINPALFQTLEPRKVLKQEVMGQSAAKTHIRQQQYQSENMLFFMNLDSCTWYLLKLGLDQSKVCSSNAKTFCRTWSSEY